MTFRAIGVAVQSQETGFVVHVRFVQVDETGQEVILSEQAFTVATKAALKTKCDEQLAALKKAHQDAARTIDIAGKVLAEVTV